MSDTGLKGRRSQPTGYQGSGTKSAGCQEPFQRRLPVVLSLVALAVGLVKTGVAQTPPTDDPTVLSSSTSSEGAQARDISTAVAEAVSQGFAGAVLVAGHGKILINQGFGSEKGVRITQNTRFWIASAGKQFTSTAILKCQERGLLSLEDKISRFFPAAPQDKRSITVEQLVRHSSGLGQSYVSEATGNRDSVVRRMLAEPLVGAPGKEFHYSNSNYQLAVAIVEVVTRRPYREFVRDEFWNPSGLKDTGFSGDPGAKGVAPARYPVPKRLRRTNWGGEGVYSTVGDLYRWYISLRGGRLLSATSFARLLKGTIPIAEGQVALGWFVGKSANGNVRVFTRGNEDFGANSLVYIYPEFDTEIIVLTHAGNASDLSWSRLVHAKIEHILEL